MQVKQDNTEVIDKAEEERFRNLYKAGQGDVQRLIGGAKRCDKMARQCRKNNDYRHTVYEYKMLRKMSFMLRKWAREEV